MEGGAGYNAAADLIERNLVERRPLGPTLCPGRRKSCVKYRPSTLSDQDSVIRRRYVHPPLKAADSLLSEQKGKVKRKKAIE